MAPVKGKTNTRPSNKTGSTKYNGYAVDGGTDLPIDIGGRAFASTVGQYHPFFSPGDNLFRSLLEIRLLSVTQANCINDKTFYSLGNGLQVQDQEFPKDFDRKINGKNQNIDDVLKAVYESLWQDGNKFIEVVRVEVGGQKYVHVYPHNNMDCRFAEAEDGCDPTHVIRSREFRRDGYYNWRKTHKPLTIPIWTDSVLADYDVWMQDENDTRVTRTMLVVRNEVQGIDFYGLPSNYSGFMNAYLEYSATRFNLDNFENNLFMAGILSVLGQLSDPEAKNLLKDIRSTHMGKGKRQRVFVVSSEQGINDTKFTPFTQQHEGHFVEFDKHEEGKIISANGWSKDLLDLKESSGLGKGGSYLAMLFKLKFNTIIKPAQTMVLNNFIFPLMQIIDDFKGTEFYKLPWIIQPVIPVSLESILDINSLLTVDEGREEIGKAELGDERGKKMISEVKAKAAPAQPAEKKPEEEEEK